MDIAALGLSIDSSQAKRAVADLDGLSAAAGRADNSADAFGAAFEAAMRRVGAGQASAAGITAALQSVERAVDRVEAALLPMQAATARMATEMVRSSAASQQATAGQDAFAGAVGRTTVAVGQQAAVVDAHNNIVMRSGMAYSQSTGGMQNMMFQMNDMGMMLASGANPFTTIIQQGSQIVQMFGPGVGVAAALRSVGSSLLTYLTNPLTLAVLGFAAAAAGASALFRAITGGSNDVEGDLARHGDLIARIRDLYGEASDEAADYATRSAAVLRVQTEAAARALREDIAGSVQTALRFVPDPPPNVVGNMFGDQFADVIRDWQNFQPFMAAFEAFQSSVASGAPDFVTLEDAIARVVDAADSDVLIDMWTDMRGVIMEGAEWQRQLEATDPALRLLEGGAARASAAVRGLSDALNEIRGIGLPDLSDLEVLQQAVGNMPATSGGLTSWAAQGEVNAALVRLQERAAEGVAERAREAALGSMTAMQRAIAEENASYQEQVELLTGLGMSQAVLNREAATHAQNLANITAQYAEQASTVSKVEEAEKRRLQTAQELRQTAADMLADERRRLEDLALERDLIGATVAQRGRALALREAERRIEDAGIGGTSQAAGIRAAAEAQAAWTVEIERQTAAQEQLHGGIRDTLSSVTDWLANGAQWADADEMVTGILDGWNRRLLDMSITNPLENLLTGSNLPTMQDFWGRLMGNAPAAPIELGATAGNPLWVRSADRLGFAAANSNAPGGYAGLAVAGTAPVGAVERRTLTPVDTGTALDTYIGAMTGSTAGMSIAGETAGRAFLATVNDNAAGHVNGLADSFADRLGAMMRDAPAGMGITSGYRSVEHQERLFADAVAQYGSEAAARHHVAPPGRSQHNFGNAVDLNFNGTQLGRAGTEGATSWMHENAGRYGLRFPMSWEPWHIEPSEARGGAAAPEAMSSFAEVTTTATDAMRALDSGAGGAAQALTGTGKSLVSAASTIHESATTTAQGIGQAGSMLVQNLGNIGGALGGALGSAIGGERYGGILGTLLSVGGSLLGTWASGGFGSAASAAAAPKFLGKAHSGALAEDEGYFLARRGEGVFTPRQMDNADAILRALAANSNRRSELHFHPPAGYEPRTEEDPATGRVDVFLDKMVAGKVSQRGSETNRAMRQAGRLAEYG